MKEFFLSHDYRQIASANSMQKTKHPLHLEIVIIIREMFGKGEAF